MWVHCVSGSVLCPWTKGNKSVVCANKSKFYQVKVGKIISIINYDKVVLRQD